MRSTPDRTSIDPRYRKDLDGLRALAVLLVVAWHFGLPGVRGGFVGVDVFFVLSGYLIATILARTPKIDASVLLTFYVRRVKRLLPAFIVVAFVTTAVASILLLPEDLEAFVKSLRESFLFRANVFFARATDGYFAAATDELPWLHTWSLSVEWQFYFLFPLAIRLVRLLRWPLVQTALWSTLVVIGVFASARLVALHPGVAYFSTTARLFEFLSGALAAGCSVPLGRKAALAASAAGVTGLLLAATVFGRDTPWPGWPAALVCVFTLLVIVAGRTASILSVDAAAFVGKRSYSIYLWHWPIAAFLAYVQIAPSPGAWIVLVTGLFVVSDLTYRLVETPACRAAWSPVVSFGLCCAVPLVVTAVGYRVVGAYEGFPQRFGEEAAATFSALRQSESVDDTRCREGSEPDLDACRIGLHRGRSAVLLIGDSHARNLVPFVRVFTEEADLSAYSATHYLCLALEGTRLPEPFPSTERCNASTDRSFRWIRENRFAFVLLAQRWTAYPADQLGHLATTLDTIVASGAVPVILTSVADDATNPKDCFFRHVKLHRAAIDPCTIAFHDAFAAERRQGVDTLFDAMRARYPTLRFIELRDVQCAVGTCATIIDDKPIYSDTHHLNGFGATTLARRYLNRYGNPLGREPLRVPVRQD